MKTQDDDLYQGLVMNLYGDGEKGKLFLAFLEEWANNAETIMNLNPSATPVGAIRLALQPTEIKFGECSVGFLGQMLLVLIGHWAHGQELATGLTEIEMALVGECLDAKLITLENSAKTESNGVG